MLKVKLKRKFTSASMEFSIFSSIIIAFLTIGCQHAISHGYSLTNATDSVLGCSHNNSRFANGSHVPTAEPCLSCKCINANLICALRVCPEQVFPPPRGCVIVQKKNACCPYMTCSKLHVSSLYNQDKKVITHDRKWYEQNIRNRIFNQNQLQRRIEDDDPTSDGQQQLSNGRMCVFNGTVYRSGSAMTTSSLCTYCYCIEGQQRCIQPKCTLPAKGCEPILIDSTCCPVRYDCTEKKSIKSRYNTKYNRRRNDNKHYLRMTSRMQRSRGCLVDSVFYPEGHKLPANQTNPCEICFCIGGSKRCAPKKCAPVIKNCRPIIPDGQCCPASYDCNMAADYKTARGFSARQYSDFFSLLFGDEDKENSTASWDYETETESTNTEHNTTNEKSLLDAIKDSLHYVDGNKQTAAKQTNVTKQTDVSVPNIPAYNVSDGDDDAHDDEIEDEDEEEISLLDFFLKGESAFTSTTTLKPFVFNITSKPLLNGMTNSPMQIQPILPDNMKNESLKFSMLPMSLYNMVKEDGSLVFDDGKIQQGPQMKPSQPPKVLSTLSSSSSQSRPQHSGEEQQIRKSSTTSTTTVKINTPTITTNRPPQTTTTTMRTTTAAPKKVTENSSQASTKVKTKNNSKVHAPPNKTANASLTGPMIVKNVTTKQSVSSTQKIVESSTITIKSIPRPSVTAKPMNSSLAQNATTTTTTTRAPTTAKTTFVTTNTPTKKAISTTPKTTSTTTTTTIKTTTKVPTTALPKETTRIPLKPLATLATRRTTALPKITAVQINSNPSILEADINYDYSEPTLPPSLPNLRIIPFLPTDAVKKGEAHKNDGYKSNNYNYYHLSSNPYTSSETHAGSTGAGAAYSPFNIKPPVADDRVDYDTYKMPTGSLDSLDYISVYTGAGNLVQPQSFQMSVNSKLDYEPNHDPHKVLPSKIPIVPNKNLTVKPPLPPFEPEHEYDLYSNRPSQPTIHPGGVGVGVGGGSGYHEYNINAPPNANEEYASEHNYNVPQFVTIPPMKDPPRRPVHNKETVFSYGGKNQVSKFIPPAKTEGGFVPKRTSGENYIPLHGANYFVEKVDDKLMASNSMKNATEAIMELIKAGDDLKQTTISPEANIISITTDANYKSTEENSNSLLGIDILGPYHKQADEYELSSENFSNSTAFDANENAISFEQLYGALLYGDKKNATTTTTMPSITSPKSTEETSIPTASASIMSVTTTKAPLKNLTNNAIPLKLITILNNTKKESPTKAEIPQRKNNKIIDPTDEPLIEDTDMPSTTTEMSPSVKTNVPKNENLTTMRDAFLSGLSRPTITQHADTSDDSLPKSPVFLTRPINKLSPSFISSASFPALNSLESKHNFQANPIRSELDLIVPELNKNKPSNDFSHTNNFSSENYQILPDDTNIANTESYVINPVDIDKLSGETKIFTPPHKHNPMAGLLKLAGCNIYGRMYRVGKIIAELSSPCLECQCTEVGVTCSPLNC